MTIVGNPRPVTGGVDTHLEVNVAAVVDQVGGLLGVESFPTTVKGNEQLLKWMAGFGSVAQVGVEGTSSYGASLARHLRAEGVEVVEVDRPNRQERRRKGKNDTVDAIEAARAAQGQRQLGAAKTKDGNVEAIRALVVAKRSARDTKIKALNQIRHLGFTAPEEIRQSLHGLSARMIAKKVAAMRPNPDGDPVTYATKTALRLGRRVLEPRRRTQAARPALGPLPGRVRPRAARPVRGGQGQRRRFIGRRRGQPWPAAFGGGLGPAVRGQPHRGFLGQGRPPPAQPGRQPPSQRRLVAHSPHPHERRPAHHRLRRTAQQGRAHQERDHPGAQALHRPPGVPLRDRRRLTRRPLWRRAWPANRLTAPWLVLRTICRPAANTFPTDLVDGGQLAY